jgi:hypothetical protein
MTHFFIINIINSFLNNKKLKIKLKIRFLSTELFDNYSLRIKLKKVEKEKRLKNNKEQPPHTQSQYVRIFHGLK